MTTVQTVQADDGRNSGGRATVAGVQALWDGRARIERLADLGAALQRQAGDLAAAEYRWLRDLEEFDREGGWGLQGARTCAHWLSWACGVGGQAARERVRVARALPGLPLVCAAFAEGRLTYAKVRAITRVATPATEEVLVSYGLAGTAAQLERIVREQRRADAAADVHTAFERRRLRWSTDAQGMGRLTACLPAEELAIVVAAIESLLPSLGEDEPVPAAGDVDEPTASERENLRTAAESGASDAPVRSAPWDVLPVEARRVDALRVMAETVLAAGTAPAHDRHRVIVHLRAREPEELEGGGSAVAGATSKGRAPVDGHLDDGTRLADETTRRLACDADLVALIEDAAGAPLGVSRQTRRIPLRLRRALEHRDGGCRFPTCTVRRFVDAHHVVFWSEGGPTDPENLLLLCRFHHRLVHEAGYSVTASPGQQFTFRRPDGMVLAETAAALRGDPDAPARATAAAGIEITDMTTVPDWDGSRPDYDLALLVLAQHGARGAAADATADVDATAGGGTAVPPTAEPSSDTQRQAVEEQPRGEQEEDPDDEPSP